MIDEKKLITSIANWQESLAPHKDIQDKMIWDTLESVIYTITDQPKTGEWIPVDEGLPEEEGVYLRTCESAVEMVAFNPVEEFDVDEWKSTVTAWMPLPEPWEEEK